MKKILFGLIILLSAIAVSCTEVDATHTRERSSKYSTIKIENFEDQHGRSMTIEKFTYDGHNYIQFRDGTVHDPDCPCHTIYK